MTFADEFLADLDPRRWSPPEGAPASLTPSVYFVGNGDHGLEVVLASSGSGRPRAEDVRRLWRARQGGRPAPVLLVVDYQSAGVTQVAVCGPGGESPPVLADLEPGQVERLAATALAEPSRFAATRFLLSMLPEVGSDLPGVRNSGLLAGQELRDGVPARPDWPDACSAGRGLLGRRGRDLVEGLGFSVESLATTASVLTVGGAKRAVAVFLDDGETFDDPGTRFDGNTPVSQAMAVADRENLSWVVLTRSTQIRVYSTRPDVGVGRKGRENTFVELNLALLPDDRAGYLTLLAGAGALAGGGTLEQILETSADFAASLGARLRDRVYFDAVPGLATAVARRINGGVGLSEQDLADAYEQTLVILFRLLFVAYAEDKDLLPYRTNGRYTDNALKTLARRLTEKRQAGDDHFDPNATDLWTDVRALWSSVDKGNTDWGVPAYNGGLFTDDPAVDPAGAALAGLSLTNAEFGPALTALLVDVGEDGVIGPVDFRSLSVREFGTIYEGLLESELSVAASDLTVDAKGHYVPAKKNATLDPDQGDVAAGGVYFHNRSGARKSSGSYFTKPFAVEHLLDHALEPALDDHLDRIAGLLEVGDDVAAADAFFDFRCVDLAMGSGHFLVAAVDRIEARLSGFLALHPIPHVTAELDQLRQAALAALGPLADGYEIETGNLLRRQVARRCIYGVDLNRISVELARLGIWIHTFVAGLPLSFLDHNLVVGNSLTGIGTLDEALAVLDPKAAEGAHSLFRDGIEAFLARASTALRRLAVTTDATLTDIAESRDAHAEALAAVEPARELFDLLVAARLGETELPVDINEARIARHPGLETATARSSGLQSLHFPIAFPEVFLRDNPGFDCILGNPPWEEATVEELGFWALRFPGLKSMRSGDQTAEIKALRRQRPDLVAEYEAAVTTAEQVRRTLILGPYPGMGTGDPDLYKAFCWRFWDLTRDDGAIGVVLPRSALSASGSTKWREAVLGGGTYADVTMLLNNQSWMFDDVHPQYSVALVGIRKGEAHAGLVHMRGPYPSLVAYRAGMLDKPGEVAAADLKSWSDGASFPLLPSAESVDVFLKLRSHPRLDGADLKDPAGWDARPATEFHATNDKGNWDPVEDDIDWRDEGWWPVYKGASFNLWEPDTGTYYGWADPEVVRPVLQERRLRQQRTARSPFSAFDRSWAEDPVTLPCLHPRIAFRDITNRTNQRTVIAALMPAEVVITNTGPYLLWSTGDEADQAYLLGVLSSIPLDWYARRVAEIHVNFHLFNAFPIPRPAADDPIRGRVIDIAGQLAAVDDRYADWAKAVGVPVGSVTDETVKADLVAELDAAVALLYGLTAGEVRHVFETFHVGWAYQPRLDAALAHFERLKR